MFGFLRRMFFKVKNSHDSYKIYSELDVASLEAYFSRELASCIYIKPESRSKVLSHLMHEKSLTKTENKLTLAEKKKIGINSRLSVTKELVDILSSEGLALDNPKQMLRDIHVKATVERLMDLSFARSRSLGIEKFKFIAFKEDCCSWCKTNDGVEFGIDVLNTIRAECICKPVCGGVISSVLDKLI